MRIYIETLVGLAPRQDGVRETNIQLPCARPLKPLIDASHCGIDFDRRDSEFSVQIDHFHVEREGACLWVVHWKLEDLLLPFHEARIGLGLRA